MFKNLAILIVVFVYSNATLVGNYYWRDFNGVIPKDAFNASTNMHIAQGLTRDGQILVGYVDNTSSSLLAVDHKTNLPVEIKTNIKVLCTLRPGNFVWASTDYKYKEQSQLILVYGGTNEVNELYTFGNLAIARHQLSNEYVIGFHDVTLDGNIYYIYKGEAHAAPEFDELYYYL